MRGSARATVFVLLVASRIALACDSQRDLSLLPCPLAPPVDRIVDASPEIEAEADARREAPGHSVVKDAEVDSAFFESGDTFNTGVFDIAFGEPGTVYVASQFGIYKSNDGGHVWTLRNAGLDVFETSGISIASDPSDPTRLYYTARRTVGHDYVFVSADGAATWTAVDVSFPTRRDYDVYKIIVDPTHGPLLLSKQAKAPWAPVLLKQERSGGWSAAPILDPGDAGRDQNTPTALIRTPGSLYCTLIGADQRGGLFRSIDGGDTWVRSDSGIAADHAWRVAGIAAAPSNPSILYAGIAIYPTTQAIVYKSTDAGAHWTGLSDGLPSDDSSIYSLAVHPTDPNIVFAGMSYGDLYKTTDGGMSWARKYRSPIVFGPDIRVIAFKPNEPDTVFIGTDTNLLVTRTSGE